MSVVPAETLKEGISYDVTIKAYDKNGAEIEGFIYNFALN